MITDMILNVLFMPAYLLLNTLKVLRLDVGFELPPNIFEVIKDLTVGVCYVVPIARLLPIFLTRIGLMVFKVGWAIVVRIKSFVPGMGS